MERCPVCRARYRGDRDCKRCGSDLSVLTAIEEQAQDACATAIYSLAAGDLQSADESAQRALHLHNTPFASALKGFIISLDDI